MEGYKGFTLKNGQLWCRDIQFNIFESKYHLSSLVVCKSGFHFCKLITDVFRHYPSTRSTRYGRTISGMDVLSFSDTYCTNQLTLVELLDGVYFEEGIYVYRFSKGQLHSTIDPAKEYINGDKYWYFQGELHRDDGPAIEWSSGFKVWYSHGKIHRECGPAIEYPDGTKEWRRQDKKHRVDGPAVIHPNGDEEWWKYGYRHRADGPAVTCGDSKEWYLKGKLVGENFQKLEKRKRQRHTCVPLAT